MLILLPPSEGKATPAGGDPLDLGSLAFAEQLDPARRKLIAGLEKLGKRRPETGVKALGISPGQAGDVARDAELMAAPVGPASEVYTGVLFDRLDLAGLSARARKRAEENLLIASGLWGFLRPGDRIPFYRFSMKSKLPRIGGLAAFWREPLATATEKSGDDRPGNLVLDMRSGAYSAAWRPRHADLLAVRAFTGCGSDRKVVSHMAKAVRGEVARMVLSAGRMPEDAVEVAEAVESSGAVAGFEVGLLPGTLEVTVPPEYLKAS